MYSDNDLSAFNGKRRPDYERMLCDLRAGRVDVVVAWHADRLHRSPVELERYIALCDPLGIPTHTVRAGELDLATASGRMTARITGAVARHESEQKGERVKRQKQQAQADGKYLGGRRPFGYAPDGITLRPTVEQLREICHRTNSLYGTPMPGHADLVEMAAKLTIEADAIKDAFRRVLAGESMRTLFQEWNAAGLTTSTGQPWNGSRIRAVLLRPRNAGLIGNTRTKGRNIPHVVGPATWEPIVDVETWEALRAKLTDPGRLTHQGNISRKLVGSYLYRCECGALLGSGGTRARDGRGRYSCPHMHLARGAGPIDDLVYGVVEHLLCRDNIQLIPDTPDVEPLRARVNVLRARSEEIAALMADPDSGMTSAQFKLANERVQRELSALEAQIGQITQGNALAGVADAKDPVKAFRGAGIERQRAVIDALMIVTVKRARPGRQPGGTYFDAESIVIEPKIDTATAALK